MSSDTLFVTLDSRRIAKLIGSAKESVCYAGPGIQKGPAQALRAVAERLEPAMVTVCIDFDERVMRMGYGDMEAVQLLVNAGIVVRTAPGLRAAIIIVDGEGFIFTPTALYLEAEATSDASANALRLSSTQVAEALARLSPAAKGLAKARAATDEERQRIDGLPVEVSTSPIPTKQMAELSARLIDVPPVQFDVARQVRVFEPYLQYVELILTGAAIQKRRLEIPPIIQRFGSNKDLERRLHATFDLITEASEFSSKELENELNGIRKDLTPSLGRNHGRVLMKAKKPLLASRLATFQTHLEAYKETVRAGLQEHLDKSRQLIIDHYLPLVVKDPPDALEGQLSHSVTEADARKWLEKILKKTFPSAASLVENMQFDVLYKDVTYETLNRPHFLESVKAAFPMEDWDQPFDEFRAAGELKGKETRD